ncbi:hypothetical protein Mal15_47760 [Stieleria maiorica]|uniref:Uncharacterized protein n=1 Tax=Stieleria maiorica TaxID=2795974 RepID=A0A5B9MIG5_9BACT|nr:hypothetical protein [Stieleria maiorica]QEG00704.1 hypothetical protein Mal15_47760 [Stieleria maiorica]
MKSDLPDPIESTPVEVRVVRELGKGRAATARLVDATFADGSTRRVVEKVFCPGLLTRTIYRLCFFAPFAYQFNRDAILACFFRRRVAAEVLRRHQVDADVAMPLVAMPLVAMPLYVRFDAAAPGWVLAAEHVDGRGLRPAAPGESVGEIDQLVDVMRQTSEALIRSGLTGSGWQVDPRAMVSTANLLRRGDRYTIVDLESGIPAVLVPKYWLLAASARTFPPFDDLDETRLRSQTFDAVADVEALIHHTSRWKAAEPAPLRLASWKRLTGKLRRRVGRSLRAAWHLLSRPRYQTYVGLRYIRHAIRRWEREQRIGSDDAAELSRQVDAQEVATYARGMALHLAVKACSPWVVPAKYGGLLAAIATGNVWFLLPWLVLPLARTLVTLLSWFSSGRSVRHLEALLWGLLPTIGSLAFPIQLLVRRPLLAHFLIRDFASRLGRRLPIYGGKDSRTEMMLIGWCDRILMATGLVSRTDSSPEDSLPEEETGSNAPNVASPSGQAAVAAVTKQAA